MREPKDSSAFQIPVRAEGESPTGLALWWRLWLWAASGVASALGGALTGLVIELLMSLWRPPRPMLDGLGFAPERILLIWALPGVCFSLAQWPVLRRYARLSATGAVLWVVVGALGAVSGYLAALVSTFVLVENLARALSILVVGPAVGGAVGGLFQLIVLRSRLWLAPLWIAASALGCWMMFVVAPAFTGSIPASPWREPLAWALGGVSYGVVTGLALVCLLREASPAQIQAEEAG